MEIMKLIAGRNVKDSQEANRIMAGFLIEDKKRLEELGSEGPGFYMKQTTHLRPTFYSKSNVLSNAQNTVRVDKDGEKVLVTYLNANGTDGSSYEMLK